MTDLVTYPMVCGSVAAKASRLGVAMHEAGYRQLGLEYRYLAVGTDRLEDAIAAFRALRIRGFGVSMPYKSAIVPYLDECSPDVLAIGACNTVVQEKGRLLGYNTDWRGALDALAEIGMDSPKCALIVGAGGVARAIAYGLKSRGCEVHIAARDPGAAKTLCNDLVLASPVAIAGQAQLDCDLIVNATPVATGDPSVLNIPAHRGAKALLDVVFTPRDTPLALQGRQHGLAVAPGWRMLLHQAVHQFKLYTGHDAPIATMSQVLSDALR